jgi:hypothetical protein
MRRKLMRKILSGLCATTLAASFAIASAVPVNAVPLIVPQAPVAQSDIIKVQSRGREVMEQREWRRLRRAFRREARRDRRDFREFRREARRDWRDFRRDRDYAWYRGHRGYRYYRPGYRRHNDFWFPAAAFITGAIIGSALSQPRVVYRGGGDAHVQWCYDRWRSYRAYDNTYQPYYGPRRQCISPYS